MADEELLLLTELREDEREEREDERELREEKLLLAIHSVQGGFAICRQVF